MLKPKYKIGSYISVEGYLMRIVGYENFDCSLFYLRAIHKSEDINNWVCSEYDSKHRWETAEIDRSLLIVGRGYAWILESTIISKDVYYDELEVILWKMKREIYGEVKI